GGGGGGGGGSGAEGGSAPKRFGDRRTPRRGTARRPKTRGEPGARTRDRDASRGGQVGQVGRVGQAGGGHRRNGGRGSRADRTRHSESDRRGRRRCVRCRGIRRGCARPDRISRLAPLRSSPVP